MLTNHTKMPFLQTITFLSVLLCLTVPQGWASEQLTDRFPVTVEIDFGPVDKEKIISQVEIEQGSTIEVALKAVCPVEKGAACCDPREISGINGIGIDPAANRWWTVAVNGSRSVSPYETELQPGDYVLWKYIQSEQ